MINVIVRELDALERHLPDGLEGDEAAGCRARARASPAHSRARAAEAQRELAGADEAEEQDTPGAEIGSSMRAVAPPVQSFARGRRR